jgi:hypothetical protein
MCCRGRCLILDLDLSDSILHPALHDNGVGLFVNEGASILIRVSAFDSRAAVGSCRSFIPIVLHVRSLILCVGLTEACFAVPVVSIETHRDQDFTSNINQRYASV